MMKIVSWNVNGLRAIVKKLPSGLGAFFKDIGADIICLQESKITEKMLTDDLTQIPGYEAFFATCKMKQGYSGVCTYAREGITLDAKEGLGVVKEMDDEGRVMVTDHGTFVLLNIYFPNGGRGGDRLTFKSDFQDEVQKYCSELRRQGRHVIVLGDVNIAHTELDIYNSDDPDINEHSGFLPEERKWLSGFLESGFVDTFRERHPGEGGHYTWWSPRSGARADNRGWRLDYIFANKEFYQSDVIDVRIMRLVGGSDHCPIYVTLKHQPPPPPHSPPLLSSKRRSKQAKLLSFFDSGRSKAAKRPRLHEAGTGDRDEVKALGGDGDVVEEEASRAGSVREEPERETAEASELLPMGTTSGRPPSPYEEEEEEVFKSATQEAVEGATHLIMEAIKSRSGTTGHQRSPPFPSTITTTTTTSTSLPSPTATTSTASTTTTTPTSASASASKSSSPPVAKATATAKPVKAKTEAKAKAKTKTTNGQTARADSKGSGQTSMLAFLGKRKDRDDAGGSG